MPYFVPVWIAELMRNVLFSRIRLAMAGVTTSISCAATRPPLIFGSSACDKHADDRRRKLRADLVLLTGGKNVDDAVDRALGAGGVQRAEDDVPRFGRRDGGLDRFQIAHFAHQDHVGVLPQGRGEWPRRSSARRRRSRAG